MATTSKHTYKIEAYYTILAIVVIVGAFVAYSIITKDRKLPVATPTTPSKQQSPATTAAGRAQITESFRQNEVQLTDAQRAKISSTYTKKAQVLTQEQKDQIIQMYRK